MSMGMKQNLLIPLRPGETTFIYNKITRWF